MKSSELKSFLTGLVLGDGHIDKGVTKRAFRIKSINYDFIDYIETELHATTNFNIIVKEFPSTDKDGIHRQSYKELTIKSHPYFAKKYHHFYNDYRKRIISKEALTWITPIGLANWYMSDGYIVNVGINSGKIKDRRVEIATDRYTETDVDKIIEMFETKYGYKMHKVKRREGVFRIRFSLLSAQNFFLLIEPYITPSMRYKILLKYDNKPKWMCDEYFSLIQCEPPEKDDDIVY